MERFLLGGAPPRKKARGGGGSSSKASSRPTARKDKPRASLVACPCCGKEVPDKLINAHLDAGCPGSQPPSQQQPPQQVDVSQPNMSQQTAFSQPDASQQQPLSQQQAASQQQATMPAAAVTPASAGSLARRSCPPATASPKSHQGNALAALMVGARKAATRRERFHLSQDSGRWHCQWTAGTGVGEGEGVSEVAWSAVMVVKEAGMGELHLTLSTDVPSAPGSLAASGVLPADRPDGLPTALAKSVMQKAVRRCRPAAAARAAWHVATCGDLAQLLRRLPIVAIEDAVMHPAMALLVWMAAAQGKGYAPGPALLDEVIRAAAELAEVRIRDPLVPPRSAATAPTLAGLVEREKALDGKAAAHFCECALPVRALLLRKALGGMHGDKAMLECAATVWHARLLSAEAPPPPPPQPQHGSMFFRSALGAATVPQLGRANASGAVCGSGEGDDGASNARGWLKWLASLYGVGQAAGGAGADADAAAVLALKSIGALQPVDVLPAAVDFHVSSVVDFCLQKISVRQAAQAAAQRRGKGEDAAAVLRSAMWRFRSSVTFKELLAGGCADDGETHQDAAALEDAWRAAAPAVDSFVRRHVAWRFSSC